MLPSGLAKSSTSFGCGKGENVISAGWQVTLCDPAWLVNSRSDEAKYGMVFLNKSHISQINSLFKRAFKYGYVKTVFPSQFFSFRLNSLLLPFLFYTFLLPFWKGLACIRHAAGF